MSKLQINRYIMLKLVFATLLLSSNGVFAFANASSNNNGIISEGNYKLMITNVQLIEKTKSLLTVQLNAFNTGSMSISLSEPDMLNKTVIKMEESFSRSPLNPYKKEIIDALFAQDMVLQKGKMVRAIQFTIANTKPLAEKPTYHDYSSRVFKKQKKKKPSAPKNNKKIESRIAKVSKKSNKKEASKTIASATTVKPETDKAVLPILNNKKSTSPKPKAVEKKEREKGKEKDIKREKVPFKISKSKNRKGKPSEEDGTFSTKESVQASKNSYAEKAKCPDIVMDTLIIVSQSKKWLEVEYTLRNVGVGPANLYGEAGNDNDNLALKAYMASSERLSRGSLPLGGGFVKNGLKDGLLQPNEAYTNTMKLDVRKMTKFTRYLIINIDPFNAMDECDKTNNKKHIFIK